MPTAAQETPQPSKPTAPAPQPADTLHLWAGLDTAEHAQAWIESHLAASRRSIGDLLAGTRTTAETLALYDRACWHLRMAGSQAHVMFMVHPLAAVRDAAQSLSQLISAEAVQLSLNRDVYRALAALDASAEDAATQYFLERTLLGYRLAGVDRDDATRERIRALADRAIELSMRFSRKVQDDVRGIAVEDPNDLRGLPADFLARHNIRETTGPDNQLIADAPVTLTTDPPEMAPVMTYAASSALRRRMYLAYNDRGYPENRQVLLDLLAIREEMATVLGFRSWADLATVDQMMGSAENMRRFLAEVEHAAREASEREFAELESFVRSRSPHALPLTLSDARFWEEQFRRERFDFDSQSVRPFFPFEQVQTGILAIASTLFGVRFEPNTAAPVWHADVKAFDVFDTRSADQHTPAGRIFLDMHPREGKSKWFSECSLVAGVRGRQIPEASLVCNFPQATDNDAGLLQYSDVVTFFHEFGHLMHEILGGQQRWASQSGIATEGDFVEVPSQMLEEFFERADILRTFARHYQTGEPIPEQTVARMTRASAHGRALSTLTQVMYATYSMETHDRSAATLDLDTLLREGYDRFSRYDFVDGNRMYAAFTHLIGYTSNYYTYLYDKVIALEFFAEFANQPAKPESSDLLTGPVPERYRQLVLEPGGSKPARQIVKDFLGRETSMDALRLWIDREFAA
ncbi:MAG TPA: M3 family metallopeptidase [Acidobacteriaceae bacterium]|jgi:thimet oligopeptidase|nr:M3 family metallopeptidase [Acidobacteriaceae bacterium]